MVEGIGMSQRSKEKQSQGEREKRNLHCRVLHSSLELVRQKLSSGRGWRWCNEFCVKRSERARIPVGAGKRRFGALRCLIVRSFMSFDTGFAPGNLQNRHKFYRLRR